MPTYKARAARKYRDARELREPGYKQSLAEKAKAHYHKNKEAYRKKRKADSEAMMERKLKARRLFDKEM